MRKKYLNSVLLLKSQLLKAFLFFTIVEALRKWVFLNRVKRNDWSHGAFRLGWGEKEKTYINVKDADLF